MIESRAKELLSKFKDQRVLVVGDVVLDHYIYGSVDRINPEAPVPILRVREEKNATGAAGNVAKNAAMMGVKTKLISVVGQDDDANVIEQSAGEENYAPELIRDNSRPTIRKIRHIVDNKMEGQQLLRVDYEETHEIKGEVEDKLIAAIEKAIELGVDGIIVSDYAKGAVTQRVAEAILDLAGQKDILVAADVKPSRAQYFVGATLVCPNIQEAHEYVGLNHHEQAVESPDALSKMVYTKMCSDVYLTMSGNGVHVYCGGESGEHVPQTKQALDPSGAGDTVVTAILSALLAGATEYEAAELSQLAAAVVCNQVGTVGVSTDEMIEALLGDTIPAKKQ